MVLTYGVLTGGGDADLQLAGPLEQLASGGSGPGSCPCASTTASSESSHSSVSAGSMSGSWWTKPVDDHGSSVPSPVPGSAPHDRYAIPSRTSRVGRRSRRDRAVDAVQRRRVHRRRLPGNPGPGGWAWAVPGGAFASGAEAPHDQPAHGDHGRARGAAGHSTARLEVVSDSTYVVNCFRDRWWEGWLKRGWTQQPEEAGRQPRPVGAAHRPRTSTRERRRRSAG